MPRLRSRAAWALRWASSGFCILVAALFLLTGWFTLAASVQHTTPGTGFTREFHFLLTDGRLVCTGCGFGPGRGRPTKSGVSLHKRPIAPGASALVPHWDWLSFAQFQSFPGLYIYNYRFPVLWALIPAAPVALLAWRSTLRANPAGRCAGCGYDLAGLAGKDDAMCPECGRGSTVPPRT
jgi:hypothetical protein